MNNILVTVSFSIYDGSRYAGRDDHINVYDDSLLTNRTDFFKDVADFIRGHERDPWDTEECVQGVTFNCYSEIRNLSDTTDTTFKYLLQFSKYHCV